MIFDSKFTHWTTKMLREYLSRANSISTKYFNSIDMKKLYEIGLIKGELNRRKRYGKKI